MLFHKDELNLLITSCIMMLLSEGNCHVRGLCYQVTACGFVLALFSLIWRLTSIFCELHSHMIFLSFVSWLVIRYTMYQSILAAEICISISFSFSNLSRGLHFQIIECTGLCSILIRIVHVLLYAYANVWVFLYCQDRKAFSSFLEGQVECVTIEENKPNG